MASLLGSAIVAVCVGASGQAYEACTHAIDAGTRQMGIRQQVDSAEDNTVNYVNDRVVNRVVNSLDKEDLLILGAAGFVYKTAMDRKLVLKLPTWNLCDSLVNEISPVSYGIKIQWSF